MEYTKEENYHYLKEEIYPSLLQKNIFKINNQFNKYNGIDTHPITDQFQHYINNGMSINKAQTMLEAQGAYNSTIEPFGDIDSYLDALMPSIKEKYKKGAAKQKCIFRKRLNETKQILMWTDPTKLIGSTTPKALYQELQEKFLKIA
jgi:hypothetical protein